MKKDADQIINRFNSIDGVWGGPDVLRDDVSDIHFAATENAV